jgi:hypothetical protein
MPIKVPPLHISRTKYDEDQSHIAKEETALGQKAISLISPKQTGSGQFGALTDDLVY